MLFNPQTHTMILTAEPTAPPDEGTSGTGDVVATALTFLGCIILMYIIISLFKR